VTFDLTGCPRIDDHDPPGVWRPARKRAAVDRRDRGGTNYGQLKPLDALLAELAGTQRA
jgi:hypothetical protein